MRNISGEHSYAYKGNVARVHYHLFTNARTVVNRLARHGF